MGLTNEERQEYVASILQDLEDEHRRREELAQDVRKKRRVRMSDEAVRERELSALRRATQQRFYEEHGYRQAEDRTGRPVWLSPTEFTLHKGKRRKKSKRSKKIVPKLPSRMREVVLFVVMCLFAVSIGLMLAH